MAGEPRYIKDIRAELAHFHDHLHTIEEHVIGFMPVLPPEPPLPEPPAPPLPPADPLKAAYDGLQRHHTGDMTFEEATATLGRFIGGVVINADETAVEIAWKWPDQWRGLRVSLRGYIEATLRNRGLL